MSEPGSGGVTGLTVGVQEAPRVVRVGNSLYVAIPRRISRLLGIKVGDRMAMIVEGSVIRMSRCNLAEIVGAMQARRPGGI
jgi:antitoxin component of MazEF toxin-antitoxin module